MRFDVVPSDGACGALIRNLDLTAPLDSQTVIDLRNTWLEHHVLVFPEQAMSDDDLERFTTYFGEYGNDPFIDTIEDREHIIAVSHRADEKAPVFAEVWHTDWSFQSMPPAGTCLFSITIPPVGGDTSFVNQHKALAQMPDESCGSVSQVKPCGQRRNLARDRVLQREAVPTSIALGRRVVLC